MTPKEKVIEMLQHLPDDGDLNDTILNSIDNLLLLYKIERSLAEVQAGKTIPHEEVVERFKTWLA